MRCEENLIIGGRFFGPPSQDAATEDLPFDGLGNLRNHKIFGPKAIYISPDFDVALAINQPSFFPVTN